MNSQPIDFLILVLGLCAGLYSISCQPVDEEAARLVGVFKNISDTPIKYQPSQLFSLLGFSLGAPLQEGVIDILAATSDKDQPGTIANKYSINDLLAMNEVYRSDFTPERFKEKLALCEALSPDKLGKPKPGFASFLMRHDLYDFSRKTFLEVKQRKPQKFVYHKNLHDFCIAAFTNYHHLLRRTMRVDDDLDKRAKLLEQEVGEFRRANIARYKFVNPGDYTQASRVMAAFMKDKQPDEAAQIQKMCSDLVSKVGFVAERELHRYKWAPIRYYLVFTYCKVLS